jgi:hypothetical protein
MVLGKRLALMKINWSPEAGNSSRAPLILISVWTVSLVIDDNPAGARLFCTALPGSHGSRISADT